MTKEKELRYLKIALADYEAEYGGGMVELGSGVFREGLCMYFEEKNGIDTKLMETLTVMIFRALRMRHYVIRTIHGPQYIDRPGLLKPRIVLLKQAISRLEAL